MSVGLAPEGTGPESFQLFALKQLPLSLATRPLLDSSKFFWEGLTCSKLHALSLCTANKPAQARHPAGHSSIDSPMARPVKTHEQSGLHVSVPGLPVPAYRS